MPTGPAARKDTSYTVSSSTTLVEPVDGSGITDDTEERMLEENDVSTPLDMPAVSPKEAEVFGQFEKSIRALDNELVNFLRQSNQLGGAAGILSSACRLRERLAQIHCIFRKNASDLFPRVISKQVYDPRAEPFRPSKARKSRRYERIALLDLPTSNLGLSVEDLPKQLLELAEDLKSFLCYLNGFDDISDQGIDLSIRSFEADLRYWSDCFEDYSGQFGSTAVQRCVHSLQAEIEVHAREVAVTLKMFIAIGLPIIQHAQKHGTTNLFNLATISTFFSSVTATTLQYSLQETHTNLTTTNAFWFASLVFSVSATINSFVGLSWRQTMYRSPMHKVPWWVRTWIKDAAIACLALSVACFSIGLGCFTYKSQPLVVSTLTITLIVLTAIGLGMVSLRLILDRWLFRRRNWVIWLSDAWMCFTESLQNLRTVGILLEWYRNRYSSTKKGILNARVTASYTAQKIINAVHRKSSKVVDIEKGEGGTFSGDSSPLPSGNRAYQNPTRVDSGPTIFPRSSTRQRGQLPINHSPPIPPNLDISRVESIPREARTPCHSLSTLTSDGSTTPLDGPSHEFSEGKRLWRKAISLVQLHPSAFRSMPSSPTRPSSITPAQLKCLEVAYHLREHTAFVKHLRFSPDGKYLVTTSWDSTALIWKVGEQFAVHSILEDHQGFVGQVAWSPLGNLIVSKAKQHIKFWRTDGSCRRTIPRSSESLAWFPDGNAIISIENGSAVRLDLKGKELQRIMFEHLHIQKAAIAKEDWLLGIGTLKTSKTGLKPDKARIQKRLIAYNMTTGRLESQIPLTSDARHISMARDGATVLVSYEKMPPQLWKLEAISNNNTGQTNPGRLTLKHTFMTATKVDSAGSSHFGGVNDDLVLSAGKNGNVHIWDTKSGTLLRYIRAQLPGSNLTCIGWNSAAADSLMFATGSIDGTVRVWTKLSGKPKEYERFGDIPGVLDGLKDGLARTESRGPRQLRILTTVQ